MRRTLLFCVLLAAACGGSRDASLAGTEVAWKAAGLDVTALQPMTTGAIDGARSCHAGKVSGVAVILCQFADEASAKQAEERGLARVGERTGLAIARGPMLLVATDDANVDKHGKALNRIAKVF